MLCYDGPPTIPQTDVVRSAARDHRDEGAKAAMDFPVFHLDFIGNRMLIAVIAVIHVCINHPLAVGAMPLVTAMEWWGHR